MKYFFKHKIMIWLYVPIINTPTHCLVILSQFTFETKHDLFMPDEGHETEMLSY